MVSLLGTIELRCTEYCRITTHCDWQVADLGNSRVHVTGLMKLFCPLTCMHNGSSSTGAHLIDLHEDSKSIVLVTVRKFHHVPQGDSLPVGKYCPFPTSRQGSSKIFELC